jgi:hypothetical protein
MYKLSPIGAEAEHRGKAENCVGKRSCSRNSTTFPHFVLPSCSVGAAPPARSKGGKSNSLRIKGDLQGDGGEGEEGFLLIRPCSFFSRMQLQHSLRPRHMTPLRANRQRQLTVQGIQLGGWE